MTDSNPDFGACNRTKDHDEKMEGLKKIVVALVLTLTLMPFFPRFWVSLSVLILVSLHVNMYVYGRKQKEIINVNENFSENKNSIETLKTDFSETTNINQNRETEATKDLELTPADESKSVHSSESKNCNDSNSKPHIENNYKHNKLIGYDYDEKKETDISLGERNIRSRQRTRKRRDSGKKKGASEIVDDPFDVNVRVTGLKIEGSGCTSGGVAKYKLEVATPQGEKWFVWHKYSDICKLHGMVERVLETEGTRRSIFTRIVPSIPGKKQGYFRLWGVSRALMKRRRGGLEEFFKRIFGEGSDVQHRRLALRIPKVRELLKIPPEITKRKFRRSGSIKTRGNLKFPEQNEIIEDHPQEWY